MDKLGENVRIQERGRLVWFRLRIRARYQPFLCRIRRDENAITFGSAPALSEPSPQQLNILRRISAIAPCRSAGISRFLDLVGNKRQTRFPLATLNAFE